MADRLKIRYVPTADLKPYARNARTHSEGQIAQLAASIEAFGWTNPVLVDEQGGLIAGHGRVQAALVLGIDQVPTVTLAGLSEAQKRALVIADNKLALNAGWDVGMLAQELQALDTGEMPLGLTGFAEDELEQLLTWAPSLSTGLTDPDEVPEPPVDSQTERGDMWLCDRHRILCGDATSISDVERLLGADSVDLCLSDPPYGLGEKKKSGKNDYAGYVDSLANLEALAKAWLPIARAKSRVVVFSPGVTNQWLYPEPNWVLCWFYGGGQLLSSWGFNCWQPFLCYGKDPSLASGHGGRPDAIDLNTPANAADVDHPCPKPTKLWAWLVQRLTFKPAVIFDPLAGSGTTMMTAEMLGHRARSIELNPRYVDVAVQRWQNFTGKTATLESTGAPFPKVNHESKGPRSEAAAVASEAG